MGTVLIFEVMEPMAKQEHHIEIYKITLLRSLMVFLLHLPQL